MLLTTIWYQNYLHRGKKMVTVITNVLKYFCIFTHSHPFLSYIKCVLSGVIHIIFWHVHVNTDVHTLGRFLNALCGCCERHPFFSNHTPISTLFGHSWPIKVADHTRTHSTATSQSFSFERASTSGRFWHTHLAICLCLCITNRPIWNLSRCRFWTTLTRPSFSIR